MTNDISEAIKETVTIRQYCNDHGIVIKHGFCKCPFHEGDHSASLKVYDNGKGWYCYGCHQGGDVIRFAMLLNGTDFKQTLEIINAEYNLDLDLTHKLTDEEQEQILEKKANQKIKRERSEQQWMKYEEKYYKALNEWIECSRLVEQTIEQIEDGSDTKMNNDFLAKMIEARMQAWIILEPLEVNRIYVRSKLMGE